MKLVLVLLLVMMMMLHREGIVLRHYHVGIALAKAHGVVRGQAHHRDASHTLSHDRRRR